MIWSMFALCRRLSSSVDSHEGNLLSVPVQPMTASSSAETLTDNTLTAPSTPTNLPRRMVLQDSTDTESNQGLKPQVQTPQCVLKEVSAKRVGGRPMSVTVGEKVPSVFTAL